MYEIWLTRIEMTEKAYACDVMYQELETAYKEMVQDEEREAEALEWAEATVGDVSDEAR